jgi:hypothetical protein
MRLLPDPVVCVHVLVAEPETKPVVELATAASKAMVEVAVALEFAVATSSPPANMLFAVAAVPLVVVL